MENDYRTARRLVADVHDQLTAIETGTDTSAQIQSSLTSNVNALARLVASLEQARELDMSVQRDLWRKKIDALAAESASLREGVKKYLVTEKQKADRDALFHRRTGGPSSSAMLGNGGYDALQREQTALGGSSRVMDEMLNTGMEVLASLRRQKESLWGAARKAGDVTLSLGLSNQMMRMIHRRQLGDKMIVYGGMLLITILLLLIWFYLL